MTANFTDEIIEILSSSGELKNLFICEDEYYCHKTLYVDNINSYINIVNEIGKIQRAEEVFLDRIVCYRGMENFKWKLEPSIMVNHLSSEEQAMYSEFERLHPNEFDNIKNPIDKMAKMQHFSLPTRLLDFSINPLVALFFACNITDSASANENARVVIHFTENIEKENANNICEYALYGTNYISNYEEYIHNMYENFSDFSVIKPSYITQREIKQQSIFLVFPPEVRRDLTNEYCILGIRKIDKKFMTSNFISIIIDAKFKKEILYNLDNLGINKMSLFPELEYTGVYLKNKYKERVQISIDKYNELIDYYTRRDDLEAIQEYKSLKEMLME